MELESVHVKSFDLDSTLTSGQVFHWSRHGAGWIGAIGETGVYVEQPHETLLRCSADCSSLVRHYFALDHDWESIQASFPANDQHLAASLLMRTGLRILRQPKWECLATFLTSALKQIPQIRLISLRLRTRHGLELPIQNWADSSGARVFAYPNAATLAGAGKEALRACGLGFRARNLWQTALKLTEGETDLEAWENLNDMDLSTALLSLPGVGPKIADCVRLFAYGRLAAFPIDVWIERVLRDLYFLDKIPPKAGELRDFVSRHFGPNAGYAQQFLFEWARGQKLGSQKKLKSKSSGSD